MKMTKDQKTEQQNRIAASIPFLYYKIAIYLIAIVLSVIIAWSLHGSGLLYFSNVVNLMISILWGVFIFYVLVRKFCLPILYRMKQTFEKYPK